MAETRDQAREQLDAALAELVALLGQDGLLSGWVLVYRLASHTDLDGVGSEYDWLASRDLPYHEALGLLRVGDEVVRMQPAAADARNAPEDED